MCMCVCRSVCVFSSTSSSLFPFVFTQPSSLLLLLLPFFASCFTVRCVASRSTSSELGPLSPRLQSFVSLLSRPLRGAATTRSVPCDGVRRVSKVRMRLLRSGRNRTSGLGGQGCRGDVVMPARMASALFVDLFCFFSFHLSSAAGSLERKQKRDFLSLWSYRSSIFFCSQVRVLAWHPRRASGPACVPCRQVYPPAPPLSAFTIPSRVSPVATKLACNHCCR